MKSNDLIDEQRGDAEYIIYRLQGRLRMTNDTLSKYGKSHRKLIKKNNDAIDLAVSFMESQK